VEVHVVFPRVADPAVDLYALLGQSALAVAGRDLGHRRRGRTARVVLGNRERGEVAGGAGAFERDDHVGELVLDRLERPDRYPELLALLGVFERDVEDGLGGADDLERGRDGRLLDGTAQRGGTRRLPIAEDAIPLDPDAVEIDVRQAATSVQRVHASRSGRGDRYDQRVHSVVARR